MKKEKRKIQITGRSTYVVSLPKWWIRKAGMGRGDEVELWPRPDGSLLIRPEGRAERERKTAFIDGALYGEDEESRLLIGYYLNGYDIIHMRLRKDPALRRKVKEVIKDKLIGVEVIQEETDNLVAQCLLGYAELPLKTALSRMGILSVSMYRDALKALENHNKMLAEDVASRDDEVDRLYFFVTRQLNMALTYRNIMEEMGLRRPSECMEYRIAAKSLERIADHAVRMARAFMAINAPLRSEPKDKIIEVGSVASTVCENAIKALLKADVGLAQKAISQAREVGVFEERLGMMLSELNLNSIDASNLRLLIESIRRVGEYGADIAEVTINLAALPSE